MTRIFLIAAAGDAEERLDELLDGPGYEVIGTAHGLHAASEVHLERADVVVMDAAEAPAEELLEELEEARLLPRAPLVLLMDGAPAVWVNQAIRAGVRGVLPADVGAEQLAKAIDAVGKGLVVLHPRELAVQRVAQVGDEFPVAVESLTGREKEVLQMLARGLGNKQIAARLTISEHTVKFHVASILGKLQAGTRTEAVSVGLRRGLILL